LGILNSSSGNFDSTFVGTLVCAVSTQ